VCGPADGCQGVKVTVHVWHWPSFLCIRSGSKGKPAFSQNGKYRDDLSHTPPRFSMVYKSAHSGMRGVCSPWLKKTCRYAEHRLLCPCGMRVGVQKRGNGLSRLGMSWQKLRFCRNQECSARNLDTAESKNALPETKIFQKLRMSLNTLRFCRN